MRADNYFRHNFFTLLVATQPRGTEANKPLPNLIRILGKRSVDLFVSTDINFTGRRENLNSESGRCCKLINNFNLSLPDILVPDNNGWMTTLVN